MLLRSLVLLLLPKGELPDMEEDGGVPRPMKENAPRDGMKLIAVEEDTYEKLEAELDGESDDFSVTIEELIEAYHNPSRNPNFRYIGRDE